MLYFFEAGWHTDDGTGVRGVKFAAYFDELTAANGALRLVPGSHHPEQDAQLAAYSKRQGRGDRLAMVVPGGRLMPGFEVPASLVRDVVDDEDHGAARRAWLAARPRTVAGLADRWSLRAGRPFQPGGSASWVAPARDAAGRRLVLKAGWRHDEAEHEAAGLRAWNGRGAVRVYRSLVTDDTSALLLEACEPAGQTPLERVLPPREQDAVVAGLLRRLWTEPPAGHPFRPLTDIGERWAAEFECRYAAARADGSDELDPGITRAGIELFRLLPATTGPQVLLCTDLHHGNVLAAARQPWLVIDPKPYTGDPAYDPLQHMLNFPGRHAETRPGSPRITSWPSGHGGTDRRKDVLVAGMQADKHTDLAAVYGWQIIAGTARFIGDPWAPRIEAATSCHTASRYS
jgi:streptomycin 6-kinase